MIPLNSKGYIGMSAMACYGYHGSWYGSSQVSPVWSLVLAGISDRRSHPIIASCGDLNHHHLGVRAGFQSSLVVSGEIWPCSGKVVCFEKNGETGQTVDKPWNAYILECGTKRTER